MTTTTTISDRAMLVSLSISQWTARKKDAKITRETTQAHGADTLSMNVYKSLIRTANLGEIRGIVNEARTYHYTMTLPWSDNGLRILPSELFMKYSEGMRTYRHRFETAVRDFLNGWDRFVDDAQTMLNGAFNQADYPARYDLERKFEFSTQIWPFPGTADWRLQVQDDQLDELRAAADQQVQGILSRAAVDVQTRISELVGRMAERLGTADAIFRDSLVGNLVELADVLPSLNLTNDPRINELAADIRAKLVTKSPEQLRNNPADRLETAQAAEDILAKMSGIFGMPITR